MATAEHFDLVAMGGGDSNGAGIAGGRGYPALLCQQHDLAIHIFSASTKLIHGSLRLAPTEAARLQACLTATVPLQWCLL